MKLSGKGGKIYVDGTLVAQANTWAIESKPTTVDTEAGEMASGEIGLIFYQGFDFHRLPLWRQFVLEIVPSGGTTKRIRLADAYVVGRRVNTDPKSLVAGSVSLESYEALEFDL